MTIGIVGIEEARRNSVRDVPNNYLSSDREEFGGIASDGMRNMRGSIATILDRLCAESQSAEGLVDQKLGVSQVVQLLQDWNPNYDVSFASAVGTGVDNNHRRIAGVFFFQSRYDSNVFPLQVTVNFASRPSQVKRDIEAGTNVSIVPRLKSGDLAALVMHALHAIEKNPKATDKSIMLEPETEKLLSTLGEARADIAELYVLN